MYARQGPQGRFPRNLHVPQNYSGNAFRKDEAVIDAPSDDEPIEELPLQEQPSISAEASPESSPSADSATAVGRLFPSPGFKLDLGRFFKGRKGLGIGFEEILIIGLIFLVAQGDSADDLIFLLLLLLFIQ